MNEEDWVPLGPHVGTVGWLELTPLEVRGQDEDGEYAVEAVEDEEGWSCLMCGWRMFSDEVEEHTRSHDQ